MWTSTALANPLSVFDAINYISLIFKGVNFSIDETVPKEFTTTATGSGKTQSEAIENALNNAVQKSVGVLVVSEQTVSSDRLVKDISAQYSSGVVNSYEIKGCYGSRPITCDITAKVSPWKFMRKLEGDSSTIRVDGKSLLAKYQTSKTALIQRYNMTKYYMEQIRQSGLDVKITSFEIVPTIGDLVRLDLEYEIRWNKSFKKEIINFLTKLEKDTVKNDENYQIHIQWGPTGFDENRVRINTYDENFKKMMYEYIHRPTYVKIHELNLCDDAQIENIFVVDWYEAKSKKTIFVRPSDLKNINTLTASIGCGKS
jgi:hypothetical protein